MKTKLLTIFTICAAAIISLCSIDLKQAKAEEESVEQGDQVSDNLFTGMSYYFDKKTVNSNGLYEAYSGGTTKEKRYIGSTPTATNIIPIEEGKDLLFSYKIKLVNTDIDMTKNSGDGFHHGYSLFHLFNEQYKLIDSSRSDYYYYAKSVFFEVKGDYLIVKAVSRTPKYIEANAKYFSFEPVISYYLSDGTLQKQKSAYVGSGTGYGQDLNYVIEDMYMSFIETDSISKEDLKDIDFDYTPKQNKVTWTSELFNIESNLLKLNINDSVTLKQICNSITATDSTGKKLAISYGSILEEEMFVQGVGMKPSHNISAGYDTIGYQYLLQAGDDIIVLQLGILDTTAPTIYGPTEYTVGTDGSWSFITYIKDSFNIKDNVDLADEITVRCISQPGESVRRTPGVCYVVYAATDSAGNTSEHTIKVTVVDRKAPTFYNEYGEKINKMTVYKSVDSVFSVNDVISLLTAEDDINGIVDIQLYQDNYTGNGDKVGTYKMILFAKDKSGNRGFFTIEISVSESMPSKSLIIDKRIIIVENTKKITKQEFSNIVQICGYMPNDTIYYVTIDSEMYDYTYSESGNYVVGYKVESTAGEYKEGAFSIKVIDKDTDYKVKNEKDGFIVSLFKFIWEIITSICDWFVGLFK